MGANTSVWTFQQLGGERAKLELSDHAAPHGRERKKPVVEIELEQRESTVRYPGNPVPTRHLFGPMRHPQTIEGRLDDSRGGKDFARKKKREIEAFYSAAQPVTITWDNLVGVVGFIKSAKFGVESGGAITYKLECLIDASMLDDVGSSAPPLNDPRGPQSMTATLLDDISSMHSLTEVPGLRGSIFDSISSLISAVASVTDALNTVVSQIDSFANAPFQLLNQLRAALDQFRVAVTALRKTYDDLQVNIAIEGSNPWKQQAFWDVQAAWAASSLSAIQESLAMDRAASLAQQGSILALYTARDGDSWDQISRAVYSGSSNRAKDIREMNGVDAGAAPVPGTVYMVPV